MAAYVALSKKAFVAWALLIGGIAFFIWLMLQMPSTDGSYEFFWYFLLGIFLLVIAFFVALIVGIATKRTLATLAAAGSGLPLALLLIVIGTQIKNYLSLPN